MTSPTCRLLPFSVADGPHNMAADEVLLESAAAGVASLRFYGWDQATVSLGYFQPVRLLREDARLAALPFVRRPSGGATLVHHHEVTYALALPAGTPWQTKEPWPRRMHAIIVDALAELGVAAGLCEPSSSALAEGLLCFRHFTSADVMIGGSKIVGSAQRRQRGALMQHGGVLLAQSPHTPSLPGVRELAGVTLSMPCVCDVVTRSLGRKTGWQLRAGDWSSVERRHAEELASGKYAQEWWNRKR
jgi:lipoate-protein ligase A